MRLTLSFDLHVVFAISPIAISPFAGVLQTKLPIWSTLFTAKFISTELSKIAASADGGLAPGSAHA